jgi:hypothetical protein
MSKQAVFAEDRLECRRRNLGNCCFPSGKVLVQVVGKSHPHLDLSGTCHVAAPGRPGVCEWDWQLYIPAFLLSFSNVSRYICKMSANKISSLVGYSDIAGVVL